MSRNSASTVHQISRAVVDALESRQMLATYNINFQPLGAQTPVGWKNDVGSKYEIRGNGLTYGWNVDNKAGARERNKHSDQRYDTFNHMQLGSNKTWNIKLPNGQYNVKIVAGDQSAWDSVYRIKAEGTMVASGTPTSAKRFIEGTKRITVGDGKLTIATSGDARNSKIAFIEISNYVEPEPTPIVLLSVIDSQVGEPNSHGLIRISRTGSTTSALIVQLGYTGAATKGEDFNALSTVTIPAGQSSIDLDLTTIDDDDVEGDESINITIQPSPDYAFGPTITGSVTILENDVEPEPLPEVSLSVIDDQLGEPTSDGLMRISRTGSTSAALVVELAFTGTATRGSDYNASLTVTIPEGESSVDFQIETIDDTEYEENETVIAAIQSSSTYELASAFSGSVTIVENDEPDPEPEGELAWTTGKVSPVARVEPESAVVNGKLYVFSGYSGSWVPSKRVDVYNPSNNSWTRLADMPLGTTHAATTVVGNKIWFAGGYTDRGDGVNQDIAVTQVIIYDTSNDTWSTGPSLPQKRGSGGLAEVDGILYFFSGERTNRSNATDMWALDLNNQSAGWVTKASHPFGMTHFGTAVVDGIIYSIGGQTNVDANAVFYKNCYKYDPGTNTWTRIADLPYGRSHLSPATTVRNGKIVIAGGERAFNVEVSDVSEYDPATNTWRELTQVPQARAAAAFGWLGDRFVFTCGKKGGWQEETWVGQFV
ncbi:MAG TPA: kelch repeat-containing protein [Tepidisphaeraceae bacterium]|nr:kelch repeat-containing protein [Tepidisphaeraceae bacterium]